MIRAFVGLPLPEDVVERLEAVQAGLPAGRAVEPDNFHVTLAFLGEQPEPLVEDIHHELERIDAPAPVLSVEGLDMFGGARMRTLHAAIAGDAALKRLRGRVLAAVRGAGVAVARERFVPHVTLARFSRPPEGEERARLEAFLARRLEIRTPPFRVESFVLWRSHLTASGPAYEPLAEYPLG